MYRCATLNPVYKQYVVFDPLNDEHLRAYKTLCIGEMRPLGKHVHQHPVLRFNLESPFSDVPSMMEYKVGTVFLTERGLLNGQQ